MSIVNTTGFCTCFPSCRVMILWQTQIQNKCPISRNHIYWLKKFVFIPIVFTVINKRLIFVLTLNKPSANKTLKSKCPIPKLASKFAQKHLLYSLGARLFLAPRLYNKWNLSYRTKNLTNHKIKPIIKLWLGELQFDEVESPLLIVK